MRKKRILLFVLFSFSLNFCFSQTDTSFWFAAPQVCKGHEHTPVVFRLSSYGKAADVTISEPANPGFIPYPVHLNPFSATTVDLTLQISYVENLSSISPLNYGIKITSTSNISAYYEVGKSNNPEIFPLKGKIGTGLNFMIPGQTRFANGDRGIYVPQPKNGFVIVATEDSTSVDITVTNDAMNQTAATPLTIILNKGQTYAVIAKNYIVGTHLGGSTVKANKPICVTIYDDSVGPASTSNRDLIGDQILPEENNGTEFIIVRGELSFDTPARDYYYIWATADNTTISINGSLVYTIPKRGGYFEGFLTDSSAYIETNYRVYVYQVTGIGGEMSSTNLPSIKCTGSQVVSFVRSTNESFFLNLLCKKTELNHFLVNGKPAFDASYFKPVPGTSSEWMAARISYVDALFPALQTIVISNTSGLFHLGFINGSAFTGTRYGYFSNYSIAVLAPVIAASSCIGDTIQLSCTQISGSTYTWSGPNNFTSDIYNPVIPNASPIYSGTYYIRDSIPGCIPSSDSLPIIVHPLPTASFVNTHDTLCYGSSKNIGYLLTGASPWTLVYSDGVSDSTVKNVSSPYFTVSPVTNKIYSIKNVTDSNACAINPTTISSINEDTVTVNSLPRAILSDSVFCAATGKTVDVLLTGKAPWNLIYSLGNTLDTISQIKTPLYSISFTSTTATPFKIISVSDANGCVNDTLKQSAILYPQPHASFSVSSEVCLRDTTVFTDSSDGKGSTIVKWNWDFGDKRMDTIQNPRHQYSSAGTDSVKLFVFTNKGCTSDTMTKATIVNPLPLAGFSFSSPLCETRQILFTDTSKTSVGSLIAWNWNMGNQDSSLAGNTPFTETYPAWGNHTVRLAVQNSKGCKSDTAITTLAIHALPQTAGFIMPEVCLGDPIAQFGDTSSIADGSQNQFKYKWNFYSGAPVVAKLPIPLTDSVKNPSILFKEANIYHVSLKVTSKDGCADSVTQLFTVNSSSPKANFAVLQPTALCSNDSVRIKDMSSVVFGSITKVEIYWDAQSTIPDLVDDFPTSGMVAGTGKTYSHLYPNIQQVPLLKHYIRFVAYSGISCSSIELDSVTLNQSPQVQFINIPGICNDTIARQITQATDTRGVQLTSLFIGTGVSASGMFTPQSVPAGIYPIKYLSISAAGCRDSATRSITVWPSPIAKWGISSPDCERNAITFTDTSLANYSNIINWYWDFGDGTTGNNAATSFPKIYAAANNYTASLRVMTDSGCRSTYNTQPIRVNYMPVVNFVLPAAICLPDGRGKFTNTSTIGDSSQLNFSYRWNFGDVNDPTASTLQNPVHQYTAIGSYTVQLKVTSKDGCTDSSFQTLTQVYPQPKADFSAVPTTACVNDIIAFTDQSNGITSSVTRWVWDLAEGYTSSAQNTSRPFKDSGTFTISLSIYNSQGCVSDTALKKVTVYPYPKLVLGPGRVVLQGGVIALIPQYSYGTNLQYLWTPSTYLNSDTAAHPLASPPEDIQYKLALTGIGNCTVYDSVIITVLKTPLIPNAFSPNGDGINDDWSIKSLDSYPGCIVDVFDRFGQVVFHSIGYTKNWDGKYKGVPVPIGTYYYIINPKNGRQIMSGSVTIIR